MEAKANGGPASQLIQNNNDFLKLSRFFLAGLIRKQVKSVCGCNSDLRVPHAGGCYESLLQSLVLQSTVLLLPLRAPLQLQQVLNNVQMSSESRVDQRRLSALIRLIDLITIQQNMQRGCRCRYAM